MFALADLFEHHSVADRAARTSLDGGATLYRNGDRPDAVYLLRTGLLIVLRDDAGGRPQLVGYVRAGECVGEMGVLAQSPRSATVVALRDCVLDRLLAEDFTIALAAAPHVAAQLAQIVARRARDTVGSLSVTVRARVVLISATCGGSNAGQLAHRLVDACAGAGQSAILLDRHDVMADPGLIDRVETSHALVLLAAEDGEGEWAAHARRQADRVLLLGRGDASPPADCAICATEPLQAHQLVGLVLTRAAGRRAVVGHHWLSTTHAAHLYHVVDDGGGVARLARILTGTSIGLVLSGGGARAFAHVGVVRALTEAGVVIDSVGGTSMGAIIAAGVASGWNDHELDHHMRAAFVESSPLDDIAIPIVALTRGRKVEARLLEHFGDIDIADLDLPFFCISADITAGQLRTHDRGSLAQALRASISLPGVLPPVIDGGHVLVDGGILRNLPTETMRARHEGSVIASDVTRSAGLTSHDVMPPPSWLRWFGSGAWRRGPPILSILMRSGTIGTAAEIAVARDAADLYVMPNTAMVEIRDWRAYPRAVEAGYAAMRLALGALETPIADLRQRREARR